MNIFGFAEPRDAVTVPEFFRQNLIGFSGFRGMDSSQVKFHVVDPEDIPHGFRVAVRPRDTGKKPGMIVMFNRLVIEAIEESSPSQCCFIMWNFLAKSLRLWAVSSEGLAPKDLIPARAFREMGYDRFLDELRNSFVEFGWDETQMRRQIDVSFVATHVANLASNPETIDGLGEKDLAEFIFSVRRRNLKRFIGK